MSAPHPQPPIIILVEPQLPENIGMCARAMLNCGLRQLRLVSPRDGWPNPEAYPPAGKATEVLDRARVFNSVNDAIADRHQVYATTARERSDGHPVLEPEQAVERILDANRQRDSNSAILFGPEASGLDAAALQFANGLIRFPTHRDYPSLNLAQAVLLFSWTWRRATKDEPNPAASENLQNSAPAPATGRDLQFTIQRLTESLDQRDFFKSDGARKELSEEFAQLLTRLDPNEREIQLINGILTALTKPSALPQDRDSD